MATWNYRILAHQHEGGEVWFGVHEVYYNEDGIPNATTENPATVSCDSINEMRKDLKLIKSAFTKPVLWGGERFPEEYKE